MQVPMTTDDLSAKAGTTICQFARKAATLRRMTVASPKRPAPKVAEFARIRGAQDCGRPPAGGKLTSALSSDGVEGSYRHAASRLMAFTYFKRYRMELDLR